MLVVFSSRLGEKQKSEKIITRNNLALNYRQLGTIFTGTCVKKGERKRNFFQKAVPEYLYSCGGLQ